MSKKLILITISLFIFSGCVNGTMTKQKDVKTNITQEQCKKMLGEVTYNRLNELYGDKTAAMTQCLMRINEPEKFKK